MLRGVSLVNTFGSRSSASLFSVTSRDHRLEVATFHLHPRNEAAEPATCNEFATTAAKGAYSGWRIHSVVATLASEDAVESSRSSASAGRSQPRVLRGRRFICAETNSR